MAKRCEVTTGAFYRRWKNRSEFVDELASYVLNYARHDDYLVEAHREYDDAIRHQKSITHLVYRVSGAHIVGAAKSAAFAVQMNLWSVAQRYPSIKRLLKKQYQDIDRDWVEKYTELLRVTGWQLRPGLSPEAVAIVLSGLAEGMAIRHAVDPDNATAELLGTAISAVVTASVDWSKDGKSVEQTLLRLASPE